MSETDRAQFDELVTQYVDRLADGQRIDPEGILLAYPAFGPAILEELRIYLDLEGVDGEDNAPLGTLGDYTLRRQIGRGGMGVVYEAWEKSMDRRVALKVLPAGIAADTRASARFLREAQTAGKLCHPNVVPVYFTGVKEQTPFFAMEFVDGETLAQILSKLKETDPETKTPFGPKDQGDYFIRLARAFADVADGLQHAHSKGVVHRDIKPSNLILDGQGKLRILDFGLARLEGQESLTLSGDLMGTVLYMSPEQAMAKRIPLDHRTDVYSLGATMYEVLTGQPPFKGKDQHDTLSQIIVRDPRSPRQLNPRVPVDLETILLKCLRKDAGDRYGTAEALGQDLRRLVRGDPVEARPQSRWECAARRLWRRKLQLGFGVAFVFLAAVALVLFARYRREAERGRIAEWVPRIERAARKVQLGRVRPQIGSSGFDRIDPRGLNVMRDIRELVPLLAEDPVLEALGELDAAARGLPERPDAHYYRGHCLVLLGRLDEAQSALDAALLTAPDFVPALALRGTILRRQGRTDEAAALAREIEGRTTSGWISHWIAAHRFLEERDWKAAIAAFDRLEHLVADDEPYLGALVEVKLGRGKARLETGDADDLDAALLDFHAASTLWRDALEPVLFLGKTYIRRGFPRKAEALFLERLERPRGATRAEVAARVAELYRDLTLFAEGHAWCRHIQDPTLRARAEAVFLFVQHKYDEALEALRVAGAKAPADPVVHFLRGLVLIEKGDLKEALESFETAHELQPAHVGSLVGKCRVYEKQGRSDQADRLFREAMSVRPDNPWLPYHLGWFLIRQKDPTGAIEAFEEAGRRNPRDSEIRRSLGVAFYGADKHERAVETLLQASELDPRNPWPHISLGWYFWRMERLEEAERELTSAITKGPDLPWAYRTLGLVRGETEEKVELMKKAIARKPDYYWAWHDMAWALDEIGKHAESVAAYRRTLELTDDLTPWNYEKLWAQMFSHQISKEDIDLTVPLLEKNLKSTRDPRYLELLSLALAGGGSRRDLERAITLAERATERATRRAPEPRCCLAWARAGQGRRAEAVRLMESALELADPIQLLRGEMKSSTFIQRVMLYLTSLRRGLLPDLPTPASIDAAFDDRSTAERVELLSQFRRVASGEDAPSRIAYFEARLALAGGDFEGAARKLHEAYRLDPTSAGVVRRLAYVVLEKGAPGSARETLETFLASRSDAAPDLWSRWAEASFAEGRSPADALKRLAAMADDSDPSSPASAVRWLLERLKGKRPVRIDCGSAADTDVDGQVFGRDRFFVRGEPSGAYVNRRGIDVQETERDAIFWTYRWLEGDGPVYRIPLPSGRYRVTVSFTNLGLRPSGPFDLFLHGEVVETNLDPIRRGPRHAERVVRETLVERGSLAVSIRARAQFVHLSALEVEALRK